MNFRSQKGATGTDVIMSITVVILSVAIVSMIYVNTTLQSRNVTRTAGATRIATNILENIEKISYDSFVSTYDANSFGKNVTDDDRYIGYKSFTRTEIFNTRIPKGYTVYLKAEPAYGSYEDSEDEFDLVRDIELVVTYSVGDTIESVDFSTTKSREIIGEVNEPNTDILASQGIVSDTQGKKFFPIKYSEDARAYIKTTESDPDWYNYSSKKWAMVIVSNQGESSLFDVNGKFVATTNYARFVWIPRFFYQGTLGEESFSEFTYLTTTDAIVSGVLPSVDGTSSTLFYTTHVGKNINSTEYTDTQFIITGGQQLTGKWINAGTAGDTTEIEKDDQGKILNTSKYGPCEIH